MTNIVVLGGGYSGLLAARLLARQANTKVTLVNAGDRFVERVRLHQLASGQSPRDLPLAEMLGDSGVELINDRVTAIEADGRTVRLATEPRTVDYDFLFYALGSQADFDSVPGVVDHAYTVTDADHATRLRERLGLGGVVAVVGGGLTGIETAAELAESHPELTVRLVTGDDFGGALSDRGRRHLRHAFARLHIETRDRARVCEVRADGLRLADGEHVDADTVVWTTGFRVPPLARQAGFAVDANDRMVVDDTLCSVSHPNVYGIGDAAAIHGVDGQECRMACAVAVPASARAVGAFIDRLAGRQPKPLRFRFYGQCISLGRRDGLVQLLRADDSPIDAVVTGRLAALVKEAIVRGTVLTQRHPVLARLAS